MFIQTQETPNPDSLMFLPGEEVMGHAREPLTFSKSDACTESKFARRLLDIAGVRSVFLGRDFITVTKEPLFDWFALKPHILGLIMEQFVNKLPILDNTVPPSPSHNLDRSVSVSIDDPIIAQIQEIIESRVRPAVANDGGDIVFHSFEEGVVYLQMKGACNGCPSSSVTLKSGIENMLKFYIPEVLEVRQVEL